MFSVNCDGSFNGFSPDKDIVCVIPAGIQCLLLEIDSVIVLKTLTLKVTIGDRPGKRN